MYLYSLLLAETDGTGLLLMQVTTCKAYHSGLGRKRYTVGTDDREPYDRRSECSVPLLYRFVYSSRWNAIVHGPY